MNQITINDAGGPTPQDIARRMKGCLAWTAEDHADEKAYMDSRYTGRFHELGATVRIIATGEIGWVQQRNEPSAGGRFFLHEKPGVLFRGDELETIND
ncbi:hypothetical protein [Mesorhizobium sp.]|uniref:hypothetical protein n=1 Tax=Mesorhizobium sp. TaxID=1871066 RepID=UPI0025C5A293|nr:hypothetical protein [Mesorhizobium sp.]